MRLRQVPALVRRDDGEGGTEREPSPPRHRRRDPDAREVQTVGTPQPVRELVLEKVETISSRDSPAIGSSAIGDQTCQRDGGSVMRTVSRSIQP